MNQRNSFASLAGQLAALNQNTVEVVTKLNDIVTSQQSAVSISLIDEFGTKTEYYMPTVGFLKNEIDKINTNIKRLAGIDTTTNIIDGKSIKKVYVTDLNNEPYPVASINEITKFQPINNHFFDSMINPLLTIELDLSDKVTSDVNKILSRRYIVRFERNSDFTLTSDGLKSFNSFQEKFLNRTDINISEFEDWYAVESDVGILKDVVEPYDEQVFDLSVNEVNYHGLFSIIKTENDTLNKKFWYHVNTLTYYTLDGNDVTLSVGDNLALNRLSTSSRWVVKEVNTESSNYRLILERVEGYDPIPIGTNILRYYSDLSYQKKVKISVGFDEFTVLFIKPINTHSNVISSTWSNGTSFYSNDLILTTDSNTDLSQFYLRKVYDYGKLLEDMILKKIPSEYAEKPNKVALDVSNFKVVQINQHLTDTENSRVLRNLHSNKITSKAKLSQINSAVIDKNKELNTRTFSSISDYNSVNNELQKLINDQEKETKTLSSLVSQIGTKKTESKSDAKFRLRGFWNIPAPIYNGKTEAQHIVQFRVQYRYSAKSGQLNPTAGFKIYSSANSEAATTDGRVAIPTPPPPPPRTGGVAGAVLKGNIKASSVQTGTAETTDKIKTGYFSNWVEFITDVRKRYWDPERGMWYWKVEDVEDADTPNINQLDIPIQPNEKVEVRMKAISEVGWPETLVESDWSDIMTIEFPNDLDSILNENDFILKEATQDESLVSMESTLTSRGIYRHVQDSFYLNETYFSHSDKSVQVGFKDSNGNFLNLYDYLQQLTDRIKTLESQISQAKGELEVYLHSPNGGIRKIRDKDLLNLTVELEDYSVEASGATAARDYYNTITLLDGYRLEFKNISSSSALGLISSRNYDSGNTSNTFYQYGNSKALFVDYNNDLYTQFDNQFVWFSDNSGGDQIYSGTSAQGSNAILGSVNWNLGTSGESSGFYNSLFNVISDAKWTGGGSSKDLYVTVHPRIYNSSDLVENGQERKKGISASDSYFIDMYAYFKLDGNKPDNAFFTVPTSGTPKVRYRHVKVFVEPDTLSRPFEFDIKFKFRQWREALLGGNITTYSAESGQAGID